MLKSEESRKNYKITHLIWNSLIQNVLKFSLKSIKPFLKSVLNVIIFSNTSNTMKADMKHTTAIPNEILLLGHQNYFKNTKNIPEVRKNNRKFSFCNKNQ